MTREGYKKHKDLIEQWVNGAEIEFLTIDKKWINAAEPNWLTELEYRVKPEKFDGNFRNDRLYKLKHTGKFCHIAKKPYHSNYTEEEVFQHRKFTYVGSIPFIKTGRLVFSTKGYYAMFADQNYDYVVAEYDLEDNLIKEYSC